MSSLRAGIAGIGFWADGLPSWNDALAFAHEGTLPENPPAKPSPRLLAPNERRRAPESVAVALEVESMRSKSDRPIRLTAGASGRPPGFSDRQTVGRRGSRSIQ